MSSTERFEAASISITSSEVPSAIDDAGLADAARRQGRPVDAVQRAGEDLRHRGLAGAARADEQVGVVDAVALDRVAERADDVLLPDDVGERPRAMTAVEGLLGHERLSLDAPSP